MLELPVVLLPIARRRLAICGCSLPIRSRAAADAGRPSPRDRRGLQSRRGAIVCLAQLSCEPLGFVAEFLGGVVALLSHAVPLAGGLVATPGRLIALGGHLRPGGPCSAALEGSFAALGPRGLVVVLGRLVRGAASQLAVGGGLVSVRGALIHISQRLIAIGCALIDVGGRLIRIRGTLVSLRCRLIRLLPSPPPVPAHARPPREALPV